MGSFFWRRSREPGAFCPVCSQLELVAAGRIPHWKCRECGTRIPERSYFAFMSQALDPARRSSPRPASAAGEARRGPSR